MKKFNFLYQFIMNPKTVGAILPSSSFLGDRMIEKIDFKDEKYIVEYGPGTGVFTEKLIKKRDPKTVILLVENNKEFYSLLKEKYKDEDYIFIEYGSAEKIERYLKKYRIPYVDYVISGLPFASLPKNVSNEILLNTTKILKENGQFITFQYTKIKKAFFNQFFTKIDVKREYRNFPPAYIFNCTILKKHTEEYYDIKNINC
ncbi:SAM-dependent methyltransferase [Lysinibacillus contaminans]|uniref:SAM-dependent methyltransferase n=1 Tax=Lysinibacillus contaminans TaxID=1293441 RepID=A0ABR5K1P4_9BACI|nr:rRNA adenine N-6-methyltransferase family protein [Lysinibacillus contaminans]KOS68649.1 SAM-dependent methyltransferase [Lysinibacillus contaminans]